jgi:hypothetical protein
MLWPAAASTIPVAIAIVYFDMALYIMPLLCVLLRAMEVNLKFEKLGLGKSTAQRGNPAPRKTKRKPKLIR